MTNNTKEFLVDITMAVFFLVFVIAATALVAWLIAQFALWTFIL